MTFPDSASRLAVRPLRGTALARLPGGAAPLFLYVARVLEPDIGSSRDSFPDAGRRMDLGMLRFRGLAVGTITVPEQQG
jgi:hypothetical protein